MRNSYSTADLNSRPSIFEVVSNYTNLRRVGREQQGLCPLHGEKTASFSVNQARGVFHCFGCGAGGDVIRFIELIEGVDFKGALSLLGMSDSPRPPKHSRARQAALWARGQIEKMNLRIHELDEMIELADEIPDPELAESLWIERRILADMRDDLSRPQYRADFVAIKSVIQKIVEGFE